MSWTQGFATRADIPPNFLAWADKQSEVGVMECVIWDDRDPGTFQLHFYEGGEIIAIMTFSDRSGSRQAYP